MATLSVGVSDLPNEVLCEIFSKMPPEDVIKYVVPVCKRWSALVDENQKFWKHFQLSIHCDHFINYSYWNEPGNPNSYSLQRLFPKELFMGEKDLDKVSNLRYLKLTEGYKANGLPALLVIRVLEKISRICKNIEKVEFVRCFGATSKEFFQLLRKLYGSINEVRFGLNCSSVIPYIEISRLTNITTLVSHDYALKKSDLRILADDCETLSCLWILFSRAPKDDDMFYFLQKKKHVLKELGIGMSMHHRITNKLKECHKLEVLFISDARNVTDMCMKSFRLPNLKYFSLHGTSLEFGTIWGMVSSRPSGISPRLVMLDVTGHARSKKFYASLFQKEDYMLIFKDCSLVTLNNDVNTAISIPWYNKSPFHWMYSNEKIWSDFEFWKKKQKDFQSLK